LHICKIDGLVGANVRGMDFGAGTPDSKKPGSRTGDVEFFAFIFGILSALERSWAYFLLLVFKFYWDVPPDSGDLLTLWLEVKLPYAFIGAVLAAIL
jgi:hypothetical protein